MAKLTIETEVKGGEKVEILDKRLKEVLKTTEAVSAKNVALGNIYADLAVQATEVFFNVIAGADEWQQKLNELNDTSEDFAYKNKEIRDGLDQLSHAMVKGVSESNLYKNAVDLLSETVDGWTSILTGKTIEAVQRQREEVQKNTEATKADTEALKEHEKQLKAEAKALEQATRALALYNGQQQRKVDAHKEEIKILEELIYIYEEQGRNTDDLIIKLEKMEQTDVLAKQTIREKAEAIAEATREVKENTQSTQENTQAVESNTQETQQNTQATEANSNAKQTFSSSGQTISGAEAYARYALGFNMQQPMSEMERYLRDIAENTRDTNDAVRGY